MEFIIQASAFIFSVVIALASAVSIFLGGETVLDYPNNKKGWAFVGGGVIGLILFLSIILYATSTSEDNSEHCGPGTEYRESRHYNPSTRSTHTDWWCEVK